ncbi:MAG TPA: MlaD family protein, partial [Gallionella sp.]|nr:MlaD family protein [Gallionella sp.]
LLVFAVVAIEQGMFASTTRLRFHPDDASKLHEGMEVRLSGFKVGKLSAISMLADGTVEVQFQVENQYLQQLRSGAKVRLVESSLFGDRVLQVVPGADGNARLTANALLPYEHQLGMDELAHDLVERLKPVLDNLQVATASINRPNGLLRHANDAAVQLEKSGKQATELMQQTQEVIATDNPKLARALDKSNQVLDNAYDITLDARKVSAASAENIPPLLRDGRVATEDARDIIGSAKRAWPIRTFIEPGKEGMLPPDSYAGINEKASDAAPNKKTSDAGTNEKASYGGVNEKASSGVPNEPAK